MGAFLIAQLFHSRLLDMISIVSYPTRARGIIVKYRMVQRSQPIQKAIKSLYIRRRQISCNVFFRHNVLRPFLVQIRDAEAFTTITFSHDNLMRTSHYITLTAPRGFPPKIPLVRNLGVSVVSVRTLVWEKLLFHRFLVVCYNYSNSPNRSSMNSKKSML